MDAWFPVKRHWKPLSVLGHLARAWAGRCQPAPKCNLPERSVSLSLDLRCSSLHRFKLEKPFAAKEVQELSVEDFAAIKECYPRPEMEFSTFGLTLALSSTNLYPSS